MPLLVEIMNTLIRCDQYVINNKLFRTLKSILINYIMNQRSNETVNIFN